VYSKLGKIWNRYFLYSTSRQGTIHKLNTFSIPTHLFVKVPRPGDSKWLTQR